MINRFILLTISIFAYVEAGSLVGSWKDSVQNSTLIVFSDSTGSWNFSNPNGKTSSIDFVYRISNDTIFQKFMKFSMTFNDTSIDVTKSFKEKFPIQFTQWRPWKFKFSADSLYATTIPSNSQLDSLMLSFQLKKCIGKCK